MKGDLMGGEAGIQSIDNGLPKRWVLVLERSWCFQILTSLPDWKSMKWNKWKNKNKPKDGEEIQGFKGAKWLGGWDKRKKSIRRVFSSPTTMSTVDCGWVQLWMVYENRVRWGPDVVGVWEPCELEELNPHLRSPAPQSLVLGIKMQITHSWC